MRHIIRKQIFELWVHRKLDALALQQRVSDRCWIDIVPGLEKHFNDISDEETTLRIDKLEVDLGIISEEMIDSGDWALLFNEKLDEALEKSLADISAEYNGDRISAADNTFSKWLYFARHGYLPWNASKPSDKWFSQVLESLAGNYDSAAALRKLIADDASIAERIVLHHSSQFLSHLVELLTAEKQSDLPESVSELAEWLDSINTKYSPIAGVAKKQIERLAWIKLLLYVSTGESHCSTVAIITYLVTRWLQLKPASVAALMRYQPGKEHFTYIEPILNKIIQDVTNSERDALQPRKDSGKIQKNPTTESIREPSSKNDDSDKLKAPGSELKNKLLKELQSNLAKEKSRKEEDALKDEISSVEGEIFINNAGLVLLHPFIHTFLKKLELVSSGKFIDEEKQARAICLMHELVASGTQLQEYNLVLAKLLCAWPLNKPIDITIQLTNAEKEEVQNLLKAAIEQWEILKNSSPEALQQTFLQREGKLFYKYGQWHLHVEKTSVDMLLAHLPWMISMIKFPWMKEFLMVEWT